MKEESNSKKTYGVARFCAVFGGALASLKGADGFYAGLPRAWFIIGINENLLGAAGAAGLASYYGTAGAFNGLNVPLWNALNGFDDAFAKDALELWKFEQKAKEE